jgi:hypothetical protein
VPTLPGHAVVPRVGTELSQDSGVWGGLSEDERRALKRRTARTRVRTA